MYILLIENEQLSQDKSLLSSLEEQGHHIELAHTPQDAGQKASSSWPGLVILHSGVAPVDLSAFHAALADTQLNVPYLVVAAQPNLPKISHTVVVVAPEKPKQLGQGIQKAAASQPKRFYRMANLIVDCWQHRVMHHQQTHALTPKEFKLLHLLLEGRDEVLSRKTIMQNVWETDYMGDTRTLDVHIRWLREKIEDNPSRPRNLVTVRGVGYRFAADIEAD